MIKRNDSRRFLGYALLAFSLFFIFGPLNAEEGQLIQVRKGDTISYLSFKIYGMYDTRIEELLRRENPQVRVAEDKSTNIQVFQGAVNVYNPFPPGRPSLPGPGTQVGPPQEVTGPGEVPGPAAISREEWTSIIN